MEPGFFIWSIPVRVNISCNNKTAGGIQLKRGFGEKKEQMVTALKLPVDVFLGELLISVVGRRAVYIENYRSILFYTDTRLKIQGKNGKLDIQGKNLMIEYYTSNEMKVNGLIESLQLEA